MSNANVMAGKPVYAQVTAESLRFGATKVLGLKVPKNAKSHQIKKQILDYLRQDPTFPAFACGACFEPLPLGLTMCPWCTAVFGAHTPELQEILKMYRQHVGGGMIPTDGEDYLDVDEEEVEAEFEEIERRSPVPKDVLREPRPTPKEVPSLDKSESAKSSNSSNKTPKSKTSEKLRKELSDQDKENRRLQVLSELPYTRAELEQFRQTTLVMVMKALGHDDPVHYAGDRIERIIELQTEQYGTDSDGLPSK